MTYFLPRVVGPDQALQLLLNDPLLSAEQALELGIVSKVVAPDELLAEARAKAAKLGAKAPHYVRMAKLLIGQSLDNSLTEHLQVERHGIADSMGTEDLREGVDRLLRGPRAEVHRELKRPRRSHTLDSPPVFKGADDDQAQQSSSARSRSAPSASRPAAATMRPRPPRRRLDRCITAIRRPRTSRSRSPPTRPSSPSPRPRSASPAGSVTIDFENPSSTPHDVVVEDADGNELARTDEISESSATATAKLDARHVHVLLLGRRAPGRRHGGDAHGQLVASWGLVASCWVG